MPYVSSRIGFKLGCKYLIVSGCALFSKKTGIFFIGRVGVCYVGADLDIIVDMCGDIDRVVVPCNVVADEDTSHI